MKKCIAWIIVLLALVVTVVTITAIIRKPIGGVLRISAKISMVILAIPTLVASIILVFLYIFVILLHTVYGIILFTPLIVLFPIPITVRLIFKKNMFSANLKVFKWLNERTGANCMGDEDAGPMIFFIIIATVWVIALWGLIHGAWIL